MTEPLHFHFFLSCIGEGNGNPLQCSCLENPRDGGAWWAAVYGVSQSRTRLKRLSSSSRIQQFSEIKYTSCWSPALSINLLYKNLHQGTCSVTLDKFHIWLSVSYNCNLIPIESVPESKLRKKSPTWHHVMLLTGITEEKFINESQQISIME